MKAWKLSVLFLALFAILSAPPSAFPADPKGGMKHEGMPAMAKQEAAMPAANGKDLWNHLAQSKYRETFALWPGKGKLYPGKEPHGALLTTYVNETALSAIQGKKGTMAAGSIVVKENYKPDKTLAAITVMYKVPGFDPGGGDWFWAKYAPDGKVEAEGSPKGCISCHGQKKGNDWLFTGELN